MTNSSVVSNISWTNIFNQEVTSLTIAQATMENIAAFGGLCLIYN